MTSSLRRHRRVQAAGAALLLGAAMVVTLSSADAATPGTGTVSPTSAAPTWTGGPFVAPNQTALLTPPDCSLPSSCDDFGLTLEAPAGYGDAHNLTIPVSWANPDADFDIYLLNAAGDVVATAASADVPEVLTTPAVPGAYTVRVVPYLPLGESYTASAALGDAATGTGGGGGTPTPTPSSTAPTMTNYAAPASLADANDAGEPSLGVNFATDATMYQAGLSTFKVDFTEPVTPGAPATAAWSDVSAKATNGCAAGSTTSLDPILFTDHETGRTFESQLTGLNSLTCYTDDDGATWSPTTGGGIPSGVDHQTIGGGPFDADGLGALPTSSYADSVYYCSQDIATAFCAASADGGRTFGPGVPTYDLSQCVGLHGHIKVASDGTAYLPNKGCNGEQAAVVTEDGGLSYEVRAVTGSTEGDSDPSVGTGRDGTVYFGFIGEDGRPGVATSTDHGVTWNNLQNVGAAYGIKNAVFPAVVAGDDDRAAFAYLGTPTGGDGGATGVFAGIWHLYVDYTYDGGKTWVTTDATPTDPVQRGSICTAGTTCGDDRNLLDFMDVTIDDHGRVLVGYADGCIGACATDPTVLTHDSYSTIARQSSGKTLFAKYDPSSSGSPRPATQPTGHPDAGTPTPGELTDRGSPGPSRPHPRPPRPDPAPHARRPPRQHAPDPTPDPHCRTTAAPTPGRSRPHRAPARARRSTGSAPGRRSARLAPTATRTARRHPWPSAVRAPTG